MNCRSEPTLQKLNLECLDHKRVEPVDPGSRNADGRAAGRGKLVGSFEDVRRNLRHADGVARSGSNLYDHGGICDEHYIGADIKVGVSAECRILMDCN